MVISEFSIINVKATISFILLSIKNCYTTEIYLQKIIQGVNKLRPIEKILRAKICNFKLKTTNVKVLSLCYL